MSIGMTYDEYWQGNIFLPLDYIEADKYRQRRFNQEAWLQGGYVCDAVFSAITNAFAKNQAQKVKYPSAPYEQNEEDEEEEALQWMNSFVEFGKNWNKNG